MNKILITGVAGFLGSNLAKELIKDEDNIVRIGHVGYEGFIAETEDGNYSGYGAEFLEEIASYTGWEYELVYGTVDNLLDYLVTGEIDFVMQLQKTPEREAEFLYSESIIGVETNVLYAAGDCTALDTSSYKALKDNIDLVEQQYKKDSFSFNDYSFDALEFILSKYYGSYVRVRKA